MPDRKDVMERMPHLDAKGAGLTLGLLCLLAGASWVWLAGRPFGGRMDMTATMGLSVLPFLAIWFVMMIAMMFPTASPMILTFQKLRSRTTDHGGFADTWLFVAGYLFLWTLSGIAAYGAARGAETAGRYWNLSPGAGARIGGALLLLAGIYQFTPFKDVCLSLCQSPVSFIMTSWRPGPMGALRMGWHHGLYCFGCCWLLFVILFPLGLMNIVAMAAITVLIFAEKALPWGRQGARMAGAILIAYGVLVLALPRTLPTFAMQAPMDRKMSPMMNMALPESGL
jgi:predicted metal-binding membrane protein